MTKTVKEMSTLAAIAVESPVTWVTGPSGSGKNHVVYQMEGYWKVLPKGQRPFIIDLDDYGYEDGARWLIEWDEVLHLVKRMEHRPVVMCGMSDDMVTGVQKLKGYSISMIFVRASVDLFLSAMDAKARDMMETDPAHPYIAMWLKKSKMGRVRAARYLEGKIRQFRGLVSGGRGRFIVYHNFPRRIPSDLRGWFQYRHSGAPVSSKKLEIFNLMISGRKRAGANPTPEALDGSTLKDSSEAVRRESNSAKPAKFLQNCRDYRLLPGCSVTQGTFILRRSDDDSFRALAHYVESFVHGSVHGDPVIIVEGGGGSTDIAVKIRELLEEKKMMRFVQSANLESAGVVFLNRNFTGRIMFHPVQEDGVSETPEVNFNPGKVIRWPKTEEWYETVYLLLLKYDLFAATAFSQLYSVALDDFSYQYFRGLDSHDVIYFTTNFSSAVDRIQHAFSSVLEED